MPKFSRFSLAKNTFSLECVDRCSIRGTHLHTMMSADTLENLYLKVYQACMLSEFEIERITLFQKEGRLRITKQHDGCMSTTIDYSPIFIV